MAATVSGEARTILSRQNEPSMQAEPEGSAAPTEPERYVARQPILDARGRLHAYELLFRSGPESLAFCGDGDAATRTILDNTLLFGLERLSGGMPVFVNCTQEALEQDLVLVLTPALLEACRKLKAHGFKLALDDFEWKPEWAPFIPLADYIKVDLTTTTPRQRADLIRRVRQSEVKLLAERVETHADLKMALAEGFLLFQGYYFCRPVIMQSRAVPANRMVHLELLHALHTDSLDIRKITMLVKRDAALTYRLLLMVNSPLYGIGTEIRSIHQALVLIGDEMFRRLAMLAMAGELRGDGGSELLRMAYARARFCELTASSMGQNATEQYLLGLLSLLPAMLHVPMEKIATDLPLRSQLRSALLGEPNSDRAALDWLIAYESGDWPGCDAVEARHCLEPKTWPGIYTESQQWSEANLKLALG